MHYGASGDGEPSLQVLVLELLENRHFQQVVQFAHALQDVLRTLDFDDCVGDQKWRDTELKDDESFGAEKKSACLLITATLVRHHGCLVEDEAIIVRERALVGENAQIETEQDGSQQEVHDHACASPFEFKVVQAVHQAEYTTECHRQHSNQQEAVDEQYLDEQKYVASDQHEGQSCLGKREHAEDACEHFLQEQLALAVAHLVAREDPPKRLIHLLTLVVIKYLFDRPVLLSEDKVDHGYPLEQLEEEH